MIGIQGARLTFIGGTLNRTCSQMSSDSFGSWKLKECGSSRGLEDYLWVTLCEVKIYMENIEMFGCFVAQCMIPRPPGDESLQAQRQQFGQFGDGNTKASRSFFLSSNAPCRPFLQFHVGCVFTDAFG